MTSLIDTPQNASPGPQDMLDAMWDSFPGERVRDDAPRALNKEHEARFQRIILSIHRQLFHVAKTRPRIFAPGRRVARVRARRSPTCTRRATVDSGGESEGGDPEPEPEPNRSRRAGQAVRFYENALQVTDFAGLTVYLDRHNANTTLAIQAGAKGATNPAGEPAVIWPIYHPADIFARGRITGVVYDTPGSDTIEPRGKQFVDRRSGGLLFGTLESASTLYVTTRPDRALAISGATGRPCLSLLTTAGLKGISEATARQIAGRHLQVVIIIGEEDRAAADACVEQIKLTTPQVKVTVSIYKVWGDEFLDTLTESIFTTPAPRPTKSGHDDFLAEPDLSGGPLGPEPPPIDGPRIKNVIPIVPWRARVVPESEQEKTFPNKDSALETAMAFLREAVRGAYIPLSEQKDAKETGEPARKALPYLVRATAGFGKTTLLTALLHAAGLPLFWLSPTKAHAEEIALALAGRLWDGRNKHNCLRFDAVEALTDRGRSPHANACRTCPHGKKDSGEDRCDFIKNLADAIRDLMIVAQHGAGGYDSTLLKYESEPDQDEGRLQVIDEKIPTEVRTEIALADIQSAHALAHKAAAFWTDAVARREGIKAVTVAQGGGAGVLAARDTEIGQAREALHWCLDMAHRLADLSAFMGELQAPQNEHIVKLITVDKSRFKDFIKLAARPPKACLSTDATVLEKVEQIWGKAPIIPLRWIQPLGKAIKAGTAWKIGDKILASNVSGLWKRLLKKGGILLDATSTRAAEIEAAGGKVLDIQIATPNLKTVLKAGRLWGRGGLPLPGRTNDYLEEVISRIQGLLNSDPDAVVITHKPVADMMKDERVKHWGTHRAHNDWKEKTHLILFGLPLMSPQEQVIQYAVYRAVMARRGVDLPEWTGERSKEWVPMGQFEILPAAQLPSVKEARDWLLGELNAEVAQAVGRLRAVQRPDEDLLVEIYGFLPIVGHGLHINEIQMEEKGRLHAKTRARAVIAQGVADLGEARTRAKLQEYFKTHTGKGISKDQCDKLVAELKVQALQSGVTLYKAARQSCATNTRLLEAGYEPRAIAQAARELGGLPGVVAVADLLDQIKRAPGAQRAGP